MNAASSTGNPASAWALLIHFGRNMWDEARCASPQHLKGFLIAPWGAVAPGKGRDKYLQAVDQLGDCISS